MGLHRNCCPHHQSQVLIERKLVSTEQHAQPQLRAHSTGGITQKGTPLSPAPPHAEGDDVPMAYPGPPSWGQLISSTGLPPTSSPLVIPFPPAVTSSHLQSRWDVKGRGKGEGGGLPESSQGLQGPLNDAAGLKMGLEVSNGKFQSEHAALALSEIMCVHTHKYLQAAANPIHPHPGAPY